METITEKMVAEIEIIIITNSSAHPLYVVFFNRSMFLEAQLRSFLPAAARFYKNTPLASHNEWITGQN